MTVLGPILFRQCTSCRGHLWQYTYLSYNNFGATLWTDGMWEGPMLAEQPGLVKCPHCASLLWLNELEEVGSEEPDQFFKRTGEWQSVQSYLELSEEDLLNAAKSKIADTEEKLRYIRKHAWYASNDPTRKILNHTAFPRSHKENLEDLLQTLEADGADWEEMRSFKEELRRQLMPLTKRERLLKDYKEERITEAELEREWRRYAEEEGLLQDRSAPARENMESLFIMLSEDIEEERIMKSELARELGRFIEAEQLLSFKFDERLQQPAQRILELAREKNTQVATL